jgi:N-acetyl-anhydromuramyl-L-alanine amidase AmpD
MYASSAALTAAVCARYAIPLDRTHILGHNEAPGATHTDPGSNWDWDHYLELVRKA